VAEIALEFKYLISRLFERTWHKFQLNQQNMPILDNTGSSATAPTSETIRLNKIPLKKIKIQARNRAAPR
jgi:hypothetical protein